MARPMPWGVQANGAAPSEAPNQPRGSVAPLTPGAVHTNNKARLPGPAELRALAAEAVMLKRSIAQRQRQLAQEKVLLL